MMKVLRAIALSLLVFGISEASAQVQADWLAVDSCQVRSIHDEILDHGECYENLRVLCKDIRALKQALPAGHRPVLVGLRPDSQRYFDYHHSDRDVLETIHKRELELGAAALASMVYLLDRTDWSTEIEFNKDEE